MTCQAQTWNTKLLKKNLQNTSRQYTESAEYQKRFLNVLQGNIEWILCWIRMRACNVYTFRSGTWNYFFTCGYSKKLTIWRLQGNNFPWFIFLFFSFLYKTFKQANSLSDFSFSLLMSKIHYSSPYRSFRYKSRFDTSWFRRGQVNSFALRLGLRNVEY